MRQSAHQRSSIRHLAGVGLLCAWATLSGCAGNNSSADPSSTDGSTLATQHYSLSARISGLNSSGLVLMVNATTVTHLAPVDRMLERLPLGGVGVAVSAGATTEVLASSLPPQTSYVVTVQKQPAGETCTVTDGSGMIRWANVASVAVTCLDLSYTLGGTISGLTTSGMVLLNGRTLLSVSPGASSFTMPTAVAYASTYAVTVQTQPTGLTCSVSNGKGTMGSAAVANIVVTCLPNTYTVSGSITGLTAAGLVLLDNGSDNLTLSTDATQFTMKTAVAFGAPYAITVQTAPPGLVCPVSNGTGVMGAADVTNVSIVCGSNFTLLYAFAGGSGDASGPYHSLIQASDGDFYGTTLAGGAHGAGTIFKIASSGAESLFYSFASTPWAGVMQGSDGNFYGTTASGGTSGRGTVFKITPSGAETLLYSFPAGASEPYTGLIQVSDGNFYGTTGANGTSDDGTVFEITPSGTKTVLHTFPKSGGSDGEIPYAGLIQGSDGNFYGTTYFGGSSGFGTVFRVTPSGTETVLYSFAGGSSDGEHPYAGLTEGSDGNFYGTTYQGGAGGLGTVFKITPSGTETVVYSFVGGSDGANPEAGVTQGSDGNLYGATYLGGASNLGTVFKITPSGTETILHTFIGGSSDGANPWANLVQGSDGNLYGSTYAGGTGNHGTFFKVALQ